MSIEDKIKKIEQAVEALELALYHVEEASSACADINIEASHHASMELSEALDYATQRLEAVNEKKEQLEDLL